MAFTRGDSTAPSQVTTNYDALLTTTLDVMDRTIADNVFKDSAFLAAMRDMGGVKEQNGGERIRMPLLFGKNTTVKSYEGYGIIDTTPQEGVTTAFYPWKEIAGTITISRKEERQNSGEARMLDLLETKIDQATNTMREVLNNQLLVGTVSGATFIPGNGAKDLYPLGYFLRKLSGTNPTTGGNVGNISVDDTNEDGDTWWVVRTSAANGDDDTGNDFSVDGTSFAGMKANVKRMYNFCSRGSGGAPNLLVGDQVSFETYESALDTQLRFSNTRMADMGFDNVKVRGATFIWDEVVPDIDTGTKAITLGTIFYLNLKTYKLVIDSETDIVTTPFITPENQTAKTAKVLFMGNAVMNALRKNGVLYGIRQNITS